MTDTDNKTIKIHWKLSIGFPAAIREGEFEIESDASDEEINDAIYEAAMEHVEYWRTDEDGGSFS